MTPELAEELSRHARVVFIDARAAEPPGAIVCEPLQPAADAGGAALTHQFSPAMLLLLARRLYGRQPAAWLIGINGADFDPGEGLSPAVARAVDLVAARWQALIAQTPKESTPCMKRP
ncbi:MAG: hypothetical protein BWZ08_02843 [candidate division BRC1 bacterium ADurb.BinA292]|nr:MAG: hypothetical protein BWZ08_02843 [candidate division BRC1 bacterium ADurb.BinA292]